jgi:hypothetical protein
MPEHALLAVPAFAARPARVESHFGAGQQVIGAAARLLHGSGNFVTQNDGLANLYRSEASVLVIVQVGTANAPCSHTQQHLSRAGGRDFVDFNADIVLAIKAAYTGFHDEFL